MTASTFWGGVYFTSAPQCQTKKPSERAPNSLLPMVRLRLLGATLPGCYRLPGEPALASEIPADVAYLPAVVEMVEQDDSEPGPDRYRVAPTRRGEVAVEISRSERVQARQRLLAHRLGIALEVGDRGFESGHLL